MKLVIDASVTLKWFLKNESDEQDLPQELSLLQAIRSGQHQIVQPPHWLAEVLAVLVRRTPWLSVGRRGCRMTQCVNWRRDAKFEGSDKTHLLAADMALRMKQHVFDTLYHAVAFAHGALLITSDERYYEYASGHGSIQRLHDFNPT